MSSTNNSHVNGGKDYDILHKIVLIGDSGKLNLFLRMILLFIQLTWA